MNRRLKSRLIFCLITSFTLGMYYTQQTKQVQIPLFYWQAGPIYEALFSLVYIHTSTYLLLNILDGVLFTKKTLFFFCLNIFALSTAVKELL